MTDSNLFLSTSKDATSGSSELQGLSSTTTTAYVGTSTRYTGREKSKEVGKLRVECVSQASTYKEVSIYRGAADEFLSSSEDEDTDWFTTSQSILASGSTVSFYLYTNSQKLKFSWVKRTGTCADGSSIESPIWNSDGDVYYENGNYLNADFEPSRIDIGNDSEGWSVGSEIDYLSTYQDCTVDFENYVTDAGKYSQYEIEVMMKFNSNSDDLQLTRELRIYYGENLDKQRTVTLVQAGRVPTISITESEIVIPAAANSTKDFNVTSNDSWTVTLK